MTKQQLLEKIKREIFNQFDTKVQAAEHFGITPVKLSQVLRGEAVAIPDSILNWIGYKLAEPKYVRINK